MSVGVEYGKPCSSRQRKQSAKAQYKSMRGHQEQVYLNGGGGHIDTIWRQVIRVDDGLGHFVLPQGFDKPKSPSFTSGNPSPSEGEPTKPIVRSR